MSKYVLYSDINMQYASNEKFRPGEKYLEYPFDDELAPLGTASIYEGVRELLRMADLDIEHYGLPEWNPLGSFIAPGDCVLVKPNLVMHQNAGNYGTDCLFTNPSVLMPIIDYVAIALKGSGRITLADAPMQSCDFVALARESGIDKLVEFYQLHGIDITLSDLRGLISIEKGHELITQFERADAEGRVIDLGNLSSFSGLPNSRIDNLRITNYDCADLKKHHTVTKHEYNVSNALLEADVVINVPKAKTHRKAGVTGALKNMVGVNVRKEFLPHHTKGSYDEGCDEYINASVLRAAASTTADWKNSHLKQGNLFQKALLLLSKVLDKLGRTATNDSSSEGSWYGNDTIWRMVLDLNRIVFYADKSGRMNENRQRKMLIISDMVTIGEGEGPLLPEPKQFGMLAFSDSPEIHDVALARLLGTDMRSIPTINEAVRSEIFSSLGKIDHVICTSNDRQFDGEPITQLNKSGNHYARPPKGWSGHFSVDDIVREIEESE